MSEAPVKASGAAVYARLDAPKQQIGLEPVHFYKPRPDGGGAALKLQLRLKPIRNEKGYVHTVEGGLYLELAAQTGKGEDGHAHFGWQDNLKLTAKLGVSDISALLLGFRYVRHLEKKLPDASARRATRKAQASACSIVSARPRLRSISNSRRTAASSGSRSPRPGTARSSSASRKSSCSRRTCGLP